MLKKAVEKKVNGTKQKTPGQIRQAKAMRAYWKRRKAAEKETASTQPTIVADPIDTAIEQLRVESARIALDAQRVQEAIASLLAVRGE